MKVNLYDHIFLLINKVYGIYLLSLGYKVNLIYKFSQDLKNLYETLNKRVFMSEIKKINFPSCKIIKGKKLF